MSLGIAWKRWNARTYPYKRLGRSTATVDSICPQGEASLRFCVTDILTLNAFDTTLILCTVEPEVGQESRLDGRDIIAIDAGIGLSTFLHAR